MCIIQVQKEAAAKEYANTRYDQPYQAALYETNVLLEAKRWHTDEYEAVIGGLKPSDLEVETLFPSSACRANGPNGKVLVIHCTGELCLEA